MSKPEFKQLLEEYISNLEIDYTSNQNGTSIHPISSLIQNTYQKLKDKYHYRKISFTLTFFLFCVIYLGSTILLPSIPLGIFIAFLFSILFIFYLVETRIIKTPDLIDITSLGDRILLVH